MRNKMKIALLSMFALGFVSVGATTVVASAEENVPVEPTTSVAFEVVSDGASIRFNMGDDKNGIRFPIQVSKEVYETYKDQMTETGTIVTLEGAYTEAEMTVDGAKAQEKDDLVYADTTNAWYPVDKNDKYTDVAENITHYQTMVYFYNVSDLDVNFMVKGYALVDGTPYYSTVNYRSMSYVADAAMKENPDLASSLECYLADYTVTFNTDGGSAIPAQIVKYGKVATEPTAPTKDGFVFDGWDYDFSTPVTGDITLTAKWVNPIVALRKGDDANTVLFFNKQIGVELQTKSADGTFSYTTEKAYGEEEGSLKFVTNASGQTCLSYNLYDMEWEEDDWVNFYVYSSKKIEMALLFEYSGGVLLMPEAWTQVTVPAKTFFDDYLRFYQYTTVNNISREESLTMYISKVQLLETNEVKELAVTGADHYALGSLAFSNTSYSNGTNTNAVFKDVNLDAPIYRQPILIDGELAVTFFDHKDPQVIMTLVDPIAVGANEEALITVEVYDYGRLQNLNGYINSDGKYSLSFVSATPTANGYANVVLRCVAKTESYTINSIRFDTESIESNKMATQLRIKSVSVECNSIEDLRKGDDANTILFYNKALGAEVQASKNDALTYSYTTEKAYGAEEGSLKIVTSASQSTFNFNVQGMTYTSTDYVVFYLYSSKVINSSVAVAYNSGIILNPESWTKVIMPATNFFTAGHFRFYHYTSTEAHPTTEEVTLYMSKVKLYSASQVTKLTTSSSFTIGDTAFAGVSVTSGAVHKSAGIFSITGNKGGESYSVTPFLLDGEVMATMYDNNDAQLIFSLDASSQFEMKTGDVKYIVVDMYNYGREMSMDGYMNGSANFYLKKESATDIGNGYVRVVFKVTAKADATITSIRLDTAEDLKVNVQSAQLRVKNIAIGTQAEMQAKGYMA